MCLAVAWLVGRSVGRPGRSDALAWMLALVIASRYYWQTPADWFEQGFVGLDTLLLIQPLMLLAVALALAVIVAGGPIGRHLAMVMVMFVLAWSLALGWRQSLADFSTNYWYGSHGQREAAAVLDTLVAPDEFWGGAKEVAYYARNQRYIDQDTVQYWMEHYGGLEQPINGHVPRVLAVWTGHSHVEWLFQVALAEEFQTVGEFGTYTVLLRRITATDGTNEISQKLATRPAE